MRCLFEQSQGIVGLAEGIQRDRLLVGQAAGVRRLPALHAGNLMAALFGEHSYRKCGLAVLLGATNHHWRFTNQAWTEAEISRNAREFPGDALDTPDDGRILWRRAGFGSRLESLNS
jgi:hypothetical protein